MDHVELRHPTKRIPWTKRKDKTLVKMKEDGCSWEEISDALPSALLGQFKYAIPRSLVAVRDRESIDGHRSFLRVEVVSKRSRREKRLQSEGSRRLGERALGGRNSEVKGTDFLSLRVLLRETTGGLYNNSHCHMLR